MRNCANPAGTRPGLIERVRSGKAKIVPGHKVDEVEQQLIQGDRFKSDDPHVLALALVAGARLLYTHDDDLKDDFKDPGLIRAPRGKVGYNRNLVTRPIRRLLESA